MWEKFVPGPKRMKAQYRSKCPICDDLIEPDDPIVFDELHGVWVHEHCYR